MSTLCSTCQAAAVEKVRAEVEQNRRLVEAAQRSLDAWSAALADALTRLAALEGK